MSILEAMRETLQLLNLLEVRGEHNIAALSRAMSHVKGVAEALEAAREARHDDHDQQG